VGQLKQLGFVSVLDATDLLALTAFKRNIGFFEQKDFTGEPFNFLFQMSYGLLLFMGLSSTASDSNDLVPSLDEL
jgi:hypothetical protein